MASGGGDPAKVAELVAGRDHLDPFALAQTIDEKLDHIYRLARQAATRKVAEPVPWSATRGLQLKWRDDAPQSNFLKWLDRAEWEILLSRKGPCCTLQAGLGWPGPTRASRR